MRVILCAGLWLWAAPALALLPPTGAELRLAQETPYTSLDLPTSRVQAGVLPSLTLAGARRDEAWLLEGTQSTLEVIEDLRAKAEAEGFEVMFSCKDSLCGGFDFRRLFEVMPAPQMYVDFADFRFFSAERRGAGLAVLVSRSLGAAHVQINEITPPGRAAIGPSQSTALPTALPTAALEEELTRRGHVALEGLAFATGSAQIEGQSESLAELAAFMAAQPEAKLLLVGHSDASGALSANLALSKTRAAAVRARLIEEFGIAPSRLSAEGAGFLAPRVPQTGAEALQNRRIEAVLLP